MQKLSDKAYQNKLKYISEYKKKYKQFLFLLEPEKDKELIDEMANHKKNKTEFLRDMFKAYKKEAN